MFDEKYYFTIYDFVGANERFKDEDWDGDPFCPKCGNYPCTCNKYQRVPDNPDNPAMVQESIAKPCPKCGHLPCTCDGGNSKKIVVRLSEHRNIELHTDWTETVSYDGKFVTLREFVQILFGKIPNFFSSAEDLRRQWEHPETREQLLGVLDQSGFGEAKLDMIKKMLKLEKLKQFTVSQQEFDNLILQYYVNNGFKELGADKLSQFVSIKYKSTKDAKVSLGWTPTQMREHYIELQQQLYALPTTMSGNLA